MCVDGDFESQFPLHRVNNANFNGFQSGEENEPKVEFESSELFKNHKRITFAEAMCNFKALNAKFYESINRLALV